MNRGPKQKQAQTTLHYSHATGSQLQTLLSLHLLLSLRVFALLLTLFAAAVAAVEEEEEEEDDGTW